MKRSLDRRRLIELLAAGVSLSAIARGMGYAHNTAIRHAMHYRGVRRAWTRNVNAVPIIEVRR